MLILTSIDVVGYPCKQARKIEKLQTKRDSLHTAILRLGFLVAVWSLHLVWCLSVEELPIRPGSC